MKPGCKETVKPVHLVGQRWQGGLAIGGRGLHDRGRRGRPDADGRLCQGDASRKSPGLPEQVRQVSCLCLSVHGIRKALDQGQSPLCDLQAAHSHDITFCCSRALWGRSQWEWEWYKCRGDSFTRLQSQPKIWKLCWPSSAHGSGAGRQAHLCRPVELEQDAGLTGEQELLELELKQPVALIGCACVPPGRPHQLSHIVPWERTTYSQHQALTQLASWADINPGQQP